MSSSSLESNLREDFALGTGSGFTGFIDNQNAGLGWDNVTRGSRAVTATGVAGPVHTLIMSTSTATSHIHTNVRASVEVPPLVFSPPGEFLRLYEVDKPFVINNKRTKGGTLHPFPRVRKKLVDLPLNATKAPILPDTRASAGYTGASSYSFPAPVTTKSNPPSIPSEPQRLSRTRHAPTADRLMAQSTSYYDSYRKHLCVSQSLSIYR